MSITYLKQQTQQSKEKLSFAKPKKIAFAFATTMMMYVLANRVFCSHDNVMAALCTQIFERTNKYVCSTLHSLQQYIQYKKSLKVFALCQNEKKLVFVKNPESLYQKL